MMRDAPPAEADDVAHRPRGAPPLRARRLPLLLALAAAACGPSGPPGDLAPPDLFEWSQERFEAEDYRSASEGFLAYLIRDPLNPLVDSAQYMAAEAELRAGDELEAVEEFNRLATGRPNSPWADDAQLGKCRAYLEAAPKVSLSQEFTRNAIDECRRLLQFFPASPLRDRAESLMRDAEARLAEKSYEIGKWYQDDRELAESAIVYYEKSLSDGPSEEILPDLLARLYTSYREVGYEAEARTVRDRLLEEFPDSEPARRVAEEDGSDG